MKLWCQTSRKYEERSDDALWLAYWREGSGAITFAEDFPFGTVRLKSDKLFTVKTSRGDTGIPRSAGTDSCSAKTSSGDIDIEIAR